MESSSVSCQPDLHFRRQNAILAVVAVGLIFVAAASVAILTGRTAQRAISDQTQYHWPAIQIIARDWPAVNWGTLPTATTPGYHVLLALLRRGTGANLTFLRCVSVLLAAGFVATLAGWLGWQLGFGQAMLLSLPAICSPYIFVSGAWLLPDNLAWWSVLALLLLSLRAKAAVGTYTSAGLIFTVAVLSRQVDIWCAAPLLAAGFFRSRFDRSPQGSAASQNHLLMAACSTAGGIAALALFVHLWHGLVPPIFWQFNARTSNPAIPGLVLAIFGTMALSFFGYLVPHRTKLKRAGTVLIAGALLGFIAGVLPHTSYDGPSGRYSGLWNVVRVLPTIADRSPLIVGCATLGGTLLTAWLVVLAPRDRWLLLTAWAAFIAANTASFEAYERYFDPFVLIMLPVFVARASQTSKESPPRWAAAGPLALAALMAALALMQFRN